MSDSPNPQSSFSLAQRFYTDEAVYGQDVAWLRENMWLLVGHESQIAKAGDYFLYEFDRDSVIVVRDRAGQVRAHHNVCRHRGSRVCLQSAGSMRALTCPYHAWSYELDGRLRAAPFTPENFDKSQYGLLPCQVRTHHGLIYLSFAEKTAPDFEAYIGFLTRELQMQDMQHARVAKRALFTAQANWKLLVENNLECYHCRPAHPTYSAAHRGIPLGNPREYDGQTRGERLRAKLKESASEQARGFAPVYPNGDFRILTRQLIGEGCLTESVSGEPVAPLMGQCAFEGVQTLAQPSPLTNFVFNPDYVAVYSFTPRAPRRTDMEVLWLVNGSAQEEVDFKIDSLIAVWDATLQEDKTLVENTQRGVESSAYRPGPLTGSERFVGEFNRWYLARVFGQDRAA